MEFMGYELEQLKGAIVTFTTGRREIIHSVHYEESVSSSHPFYVDFTNESVCDYYDKTGDCIWDNDNNYSIESIELAEDSKDLTKDEEIRNLVTLMRMHCETKQVASSNFVQTTCNQILDLLDS